MNATTVELLTVCRISRLTNRPVSEIERAIATEPVLQAAAIANREPVYDRAALVEITERLRCLEDRSDG